jgi:hypothetical protein
MLMNILLINTNPVVSRLISLCLRDDSIVFEEVEHVTEVEGSTYDIVFVDDASYDDKVAAFSAWVANIGKLVFLSSRDTGEEIGGKFDLVIKKPFLPSQIQEIIDQAKAESEARETEGSASIEMEGPVGESIEPVEEEEKEEIVEEIPTEEEHFIFPLSSSKESEEDDSSAEESEPDEEEASSDEIPKVLDSNDIKQIKALLEEDEEDLPEVDLEDEEQIEARKVEVITQKLEEEGLEIVDEEKIISELSQKPEKMPKQKKKSKKKKKQTEEIYTFEEALLAAVENMKPKKIKKLLKGAEVTIRIRFKDEE